MASDKIHVLARDGDARLLQQALKKAQPDVQDDDGMTPLHYAAWYGHPACCHALLAANASVDKFDHDGAAPLHAAAYNNQLACVVLLVEAGANVLLSDNDNQTPKDTAVQENHADVVTYLRVIEEDQRREANMERCQKLLAEATEHCRVFKPELQKVIKEAKKKVVAIEKEEKRVRKETLKLKHKRTKAAARNSPRMGGRASTDGAAGGDVGPQSFSEISMAGSDKGTVSGIKKSTMKSRRTSSPAALRANIGRTTPDVEAPRPLPEVPVCVVGTSWKRVLSTGKSSEVKGLWTLYTGGWNSLFVSTVLIVVKRPYMCGVLLINNCDDMPEHSFL
eukprot:m.1227327 g.1227327  ORF g.1227327 m.1227327 type:complete len:335 (-) comp24642_c0_seq25:1877-2881(-)